MKVALDAMGGDYAPSTTVEGAIKALHEERDLEIILVGDREKITDELKRQDYHGQQISIRHASQIVEMGESPLTALRKKKDSSIRVAVEMVNSGESHAIVSAGNSAVVMATALRILGKLPGVERPAIAAVMPSLRDHFVLIDAGANVDCKPIHLFQFAVMGEAYARYIFNIESPKIGILSIGEEDVKGNELTRETFKILRESRLNFVGNVEGKDIFNGEADVVVCDGFVGNIALKIAEGLAETTTKILRKEISEKAVGKVNLMLLKDALKSFKKKTDYSEYGGAPLLGLKKPCIIAHGRSTSKAIKNAIMVAATFHRRMVCDVISRECIEGLNWRDAVAIEE